VSRHLVFEIGAEEIPSGPLYDAQVQLAELAASALDQAGLAYADISVLGSPRRVTLYVTDLAERQHDRTLRVKGPAARAAFDADGNPTKAAEGFARSRGVSVDSLERAEEAGGEYVYAVIEHVGRDTVEVLPEILGQLVEGIQWPKSMRWGSGNTRFSRPVRWMLALFGGEVVAVEFAGVTADRLTYGHRFLAPGAVELPVAEEYALAMERGMVMVDPEERARFIREGIDAAAVQHDARPVVPEKTFAEVVNLVESPSVAVGRFDNAFLDVPREVLETAMESHQRYFPLEGADGDLLAAFVVVHNGDPARTDTIINGHQRVIRARLADAAFFYQEDLVHPLEDSVGKLSGIVFQEKLGTLGAKVERIEALAVSLGGLVQADADDLAYARRAAHLSKADLVSHVVVEFPSLQGVMGRYYALASGEAPGVAEAIVQHYQPRFAGDVLPASLAGMLVSAADKLDSIVGIFAIGQPPTGSADPYALRRGAIGILAMIIEGGLPLTLNAAISAAIDGYRDVLPKMNADEVGEQVKAFIVGRLEGLMRDRGFAYDTVDAVLAVAGDDPADAIDRADALTAARAHERTIDDVSVAFTRARNLSQPDLGTAADERIMGPEEITLAQALDGAEGVVDEAMAARDYDAVLEQLAALRPPIDAFFDNVLVMDQDLKLRENRLRLLNRFVAVFERFADFSKLAG